ncbi:hypothetical protein [Heliorestis convoluta]|uniref:Uncharacterized protein n=1 Tax=Heliorestis convoluta TaxID=356322 RepID=A0A5Q2N3D9_9FIRM|nr:hypothetical protein [Heliorestis convoluta]QGG48383.1 hypothetical protein FTV88_2285 [Heliorestis convoluta]
MSSWKILHKIPGRIRLQILHPYPPEEWQKRFDCIEEQIGVLSLDYSSLTRTVLIHYNPKAIAEEQVLAPLSASREVLAIENVAARPVSVTLLKTSALVLVIAAHRKLFRLRIKNVLWWGIVAYLLRKHYPIIRARLRKLGLIEPYHPRPRKALPSHTGLSS